MQEPQNFDPLSFDPINQNKRGPSDNQLARTRLATFSARLRMSQESFRVPLNPFIHFNSRYRIVPSDIVELLIAGAEGTLQPAQRQLAAFFVAFLSHSARLIALRRLASSLDTQIASGLSASRKACFTSARNQASCAAAS